MVEQSSRALVIFVLRRLSAWLRLRVPLRVNPLSRDRRRLCLSRPPGKSPRAAEPVEPAVADSAIRFRDVSASAGVDFQHVSGMHPDRHFPTNLGSGLAALDYDGDGLLDLYCATTRNLPLDAPDASTGNRLYRNSGDGDVRGRDRAVGRRLPRVHPRGRRRATSTATASPTCS